MTNTAVHALHELARRWDQAMVKNDAGAIGAFMAADWTMVGPDGSVVGKDRFLALVESGALAHDVMETHDMEIRAYGDTAVTVATGVSGGRFQGNAFLLRERVSCVFIRQDGRWQCVHTHLSSLPEAAA